MRNTFLRIFLISLTLMSFLTVSGQGVKNLRINEVLVKNEADYVDNYGVRSGWFEVFNTGYAMADIGGCYVTNDINNPTKYFIPKGNPKTQISARAYALFFAYDKGDRGIFHVNFSLDEVGFLAIFDQSGKILIDSISYDISAQLPNLSFGKMENEPLAKAQWHYNLDPTPEAINYTTREASRAEKYRKSDPWGVIITITTMTVVFIVLLLLALIFKRTGRYFKKRADENKPKKEKKHQEIKQVEEVIQDTDDLDVVAISTALYLYFDDQHEIEQTGFWLKPKNQQAWSEKNILFKKSPRRKF